MNVGDAGQVPIGATVVGRYAIFDEIASGGMATVHYGRLLGPQGFSRTVAIKRLHPHLARDADFSTMFLDEARVAARVRHPNVVPTLDIVNDDGQLFLVMEYVQGESLSRLLRAAKKLDVAMPPQVASAIIVGVLHGLHAAHEAVNEKGEPLEIVHRDVSPQNILVGLDGIPRLVDFGVAKAIGRVQTTREGQLKGKIAYMAPEQIRGTTPTRLVDVYAASIVLWEMLTGKRLFGGDNEVTVLERALHHDPEPPSKYAEAVSPELDAVVLKGLARDPAARFETAKEMARAIEDVVQVASVSKVGQWVEEVAGEAIEERAAKVAEIESHSQVRSLVPPAAAKQEESVSALFDIAVVTEKSPPRSNKRVMLAAIAVLGVGALGALAFAMRSQPTQTSATPPAPSPTITASVASVPTPVVVVVASASASSAAPVAAPSATAKPTATTKGHTIVRDFPATKPGTKPGCNPPYTVDANGVKQYKVDCL